jgi:APA family basic amino acid/polyamine antiporter
MMPRAGGQYVYLREAYSPLWGFLYGWTLFLVIQTGTIAAVAVAFARFLGVLLPSVSPTAWIIRPVNLPAGYALSLSTQQLVAILLIVLLTFINTRGLKLGKIIQNIFTSSKILSLVALILVGMLIGRNADVLRSNFSDWWTPRGVTPIKPDLHFLSTVTAAGGFGLLIAFCVAQVGSLFSSVAWESITFTAGEVKEPKRNLPLSLFWGTALVIALYLLVNVAYLCLLPLEQIQHAPDDRVATAAMNTVFSGAGTGIMAIAILVSTFGCNNGLILTGARVYYAMARDRLFFKATGRLNACHVPARGSRAEMCVGVAAGVAPDPAARRIRRAPAGSVNARGAVRQSVQQPARLRRIRHAGVLRAHHHRDFCFAPETAGGRATVSRVRLSRVAGALHHGRERRHGRAALLQDADHLARAVARAGGCAGLFFVAAQRRERVDPIIVTA